MDSKNRNRMKGKICLWPIAHYSFLSFQDWLLRKETDNQSKIREIWAAIFTSAHWLKECTNHFCVKSFLRVQHSTADGELIRRSIKMFAVRFQQRPNEHSWWRAHFLLLRCAHERKTKAENWNHFTKDPSEPIWHCR